MTEIGPKIRHKEIGSLARDHGLSEAKLLARECAGRGWFLARWSAIPSHFPNKAFVLIL